MRLPDLSRRILGRRRRHAGVLTVAMLALSFAFSLWPCCELFAGSPPHSGQAQHGGVTHDPGPGPCAWMDAGDVALPEMAPGAHAGCDVLPPVPSRTAPAVAVRAVSHIGLSRGPPGPLYLEFHRLLL
ncbi:hypothetical protein SVA_2719 [Sulfurifustis variabilis]|uniref:Uncharacterized protein n=1 Tax=Sulfurifustis variabilis TaxID=1675686 RepID=A0A1B4VEZ0_9GAMM|nr:hypothetical protein [Sulfurifustis variabilis]BAU49267.1 hypothetical protein SVA_2719 [Sulfurifustis variabilis]